MDQLEGLREIARKNSHVFLPAMKFDVPKTFIWGIGSGKGGVGKTLIASACAMRLAEQGAKILLIDGEHYLPGIHFYFEKDRPVHPEAIIAGDWSLEKAVSVETPNLHVLSQVSNRLSTFGVADIYLEKIKAAAEKKYDFIIFDLPNGFSKLHETFCGLASEISIVTTSHYASVANGYALVKLMRNIRKNIGFSVIVNRAESKAEAEDTFKKFNLTVRHFLNDELSLKGWIQEDAELGKISKDIFPLAKFGQTISFFHFIDEIIRPMLQQEDFRETVLNL